SGNSFKTVARVTTNADGTSTSTIPGAVIAEERIQKKYDVKARSILMMALPNEHLLTFNQYKDAKTLFEAIEARFGGIDATKKIQKTLLKQTYENFNASSSKSLDSMFNRLQKLVSQLSILDLKSMSIDDLYNNFKIVEQEVKRSGSSSSNSGSKNMAFVSTPGSTNEDTAYVQVSTASTPVSAASTNDNAASLSDATVYAFLANQPSGSQFVHEDLEQIHDDDLEEIDLKWQLALLSMRERKFYQRTGKKITINGSDTTGFDKTKVECFNLEDTSSKAMVAIDGAGFDWSYIAEEEVPTNIALMAFSESKVYNDKICFNTCLKSFETLKTQYDNLRVEFNKSEFDLANYKRGLASLEEQLVFYKKNKVMFTDQIAVLKRDASFNESEIIALKMQIEKLKKDKEDNLMEFDLLPWSRAFGLFAPPTIDLSNTGLEEFKQPEFEGYGPKANKSVYVDATKEVKKTFDAPIIKDWVSDCDEDESVTKVSKSDNVQHKPEQAYKPRNVRQNPRYNSANRNELKTQRLGVEFQFSPKACFVFGSFNHLIKDCDFHDKNVVQKPELNNVQKGTGQREGRPVWNNAMRTNHQNFSNSRRNFTPIAVLTKSGKVPISTARQSSSRAAIPVSAARPINTAAPKSFVNVAKPRTNALQKTHSPSRRPFYHQTTLKNRNLKNKVNTVKINYVNTAKTKRVKSVVGKQGINDVKSSTCWVWRPKSNVIDHISKTSGSYICKSFNYVDPTGRLKPFMDRKTSPYMTDYQDYDGRFVAFAGSSKGMCDRKNSVLFTETKCLILSPEFKLPDENQVMLKIHRKDNMYSFDLKNIVPSKGLTCLIAKATNDESKMWHRRLGHINFKTMNKLVKGNLVRGLPFKFFENNHTCVACQEGKQHKASCKTKLVNSVSSPLQILHMDLFGPIFVKSIMGNMYCLVITDDYSRFSWVFFLAKKDETSLILKNFITGIENQLNHKVKVIRCDNGTKFKNYEMNQFYGIKGIKREFNNARMLELHNKIEVLVTKPHNKTPYELLLGRTPIVSFMRHFGYPVTILNTLDHLGKFDGKADEGVLIGYSINSKAFRVYNHRTRIVEENLHVNFLENKPNVAGNRPEWLFDIDSLTNTMNYQPVSAGNRTNGNAGIETNSDAGQAGKEKETDQEYILLPLMHISSYVPSSPKEDVSSPNGDNKKIE
ncbi:putative ribonuclease H-like domain-containing protein, partial [Tanacetum coccineum]